ncbi:hypothetical protein [Aquimarina celericrescens]|uniref:Uncharacterized protein n=1 Tax=Aquimarina celericrescens TaxID=1964542 RepID=A0ABW5AYV2_9FLAO|nr:hypothetical protein [Aquimarina celericrescens]
MKTIKIIFAVLLMSSMFLACEKDNVNDELGVEFVDEFGSEEELPSSIPPRGNGT